MKNIQNLLSHTKKYHNRKRVFAWLYRCFLKANVWQKRYFKYQKNRYLSNQNQYLKTKDIVCYQPAKENLIPYYDSPLIVA